HRGATARPRMTGRAAPRAALEQAGQFLRHLSAARQVYALYPSRHPKRVEPIHLALEALRGLRGALQGDPVIFIIRHALYLGSVLLPRDSLARYGLVHAFEEAGVEAIETLPMVTAGDIDKLIRVVLGELGLDTIFEGMALN